MHGTIESNDRIAVRWHRGQQQFRAYPDGLHSIDGGAGPWVESRERAERILADADAVIEPPA